MSKAPKPKPDDPAQSARFIEAAKAAEVDETGEAFERAFKAIVPTNQAIGPKGPLSISSRKDSAS